jgi:hypothetical protein
MGLTGNTMLQATSRALQYVYRLIDRIDSIDGGTAKTNFRGILPLSLASRKIAAGLFQAFLQERH